MTALQTIPLFDVGKLKLFYSNSQIKIQKALNTFNEIENLLSCLLEKRHVDEQLSILIEGLYE